jgi:hypothetical protein
MQPYLRLSAVNQNEPQMHADIATLISKNQLLYVPTPKYLISLNEKTYIHHLLFVKNVANYETIN